MKTPRRTPVNQILFSLVLIGISFGKNHWTKKSYDWKVTGTKESTFFRQEIQQLAIVVVVEGFLQFIHHV